jgi:D-glycero-alpha-D-manno-heptose-7-phosphate kinase
MIISRTPFRISFLGGGTDYPGWYREHGGAVIATTIDKYCYLNCRYLPPFFDYRYRVMYSKVENADSIDQISHPAVREILRFQNVNRGVEIHHDGDLPARSGMGSSSSFTVGLTHALHALHGRMMSKHQLAMESIHIEQSVLKETVGSQDQVMAAYGGLNHVRFFPSGEISVRPIIMPLDRLAEFNSHFMLFYTGIKRTASDIASTYVPAIENHRRGMRILLDLVKEGLSVLSGHQGLECFGELLHEGWLVKRGLSNIVSNSHVDEMYEEARAAGAIGGKLLGAGGGGFLCLFVPAARQNEVKQRLSGLLHVPFKFEFGGSQIIFYEPEADYSHEERARENIRIEPFRELTNGSAPADPDNDSPKSGDGGREVESLLAGHPR